MKNLMSELNKTQDLLEFALLSLIILTYRFLN
jgi:hypothetical protein